VAYNLLTETLIDTNCGSFSLPGVLAALSRGAITSFDAMRPHQRPAWHMFLVQLGVLALDGAGLREPPLDEDSWREALRGLTAGFENDAPWSLVAPDHQPAFLQPPAPKSAKWTEVATPDGIDMLITSRNHDLKVSIAKVATPQDWIYALVSLQTMEGFGGAGNYGIARMNGGSSSRPMLTLAPASSSGSSVHCSMWWQRDVFRLLKGRSGVSGVALVWLKEWPEQAQIRLEALDPLFIEICRNVRLSFGNGSLQARKTTSKAPRIAGKDAKGVTGDPWAPVSIKESKGLTLGEGGGWSYRTVRRLLQSGEWLLAPLAEQVAEEKEQDMLLIAEAFARGNSKTGGFKSRVIPISKTVVRKAFGKTAVDQSAALLEDIKLIDLALRNGLALMAANGDRSAIATAHYEHSSTARGLLDQTADRMFFLTLWEMLAAETQGVRLERRATFMQDLSQAAREIFKQALPALPCKSVMRPRAEARATDRLEYELRRALKESGLVDYLPKSDRDGEGAAA